MKYVNILKKVMMEVLIYLFMAGLCYLSNYLFVKDIVDYTFPQWFGIIVIARTLLPVSGLFKNIIKEDASEIKIRKQGRNER